MVEQLLSVAVDKAVEAVWRKLEKGERLRVEDFVVLLIATVREVHNGLERLREFVDQSIMEIHARINEANKRIDDVNKRIDETNKRIDALGVELNRRIDETNKRIDGVYGVLGDLQKTMAGMQNTLLEILKVLAEIQRDVAELKKMR